MAEQQAEVLRGRTIRTTNESYEKFRQIAQENFESQGQCFSTLIHLYELEQGKTILGERKMEIENFQMHINALLNMFVNSLQMNEDAEERVRAGIQDVLDTKDRNIIQLQKERNQIQTLLDHKSQMYEELQNSMEHIKHVYDEDKHNLELTIEQLNQTIRDKNDLIALITDQKQDLQSQLSKSDEQEKQIRELKRQLSEKEQENTSLSNQMTVNDQLHKQEVQRLQKQADLEKEKYEFDLKKALLEKEKDLQLNWEQEKMEYTRKLELYQMKYVTALERLEQLSTGKEQGDT
ncbi:MAG: hypothetical protein Q4E73_04770 [Lachnospiraceae bacterium]|nr:hypothetical protein [Lachnospiraceae bacterium]